MLFVAYFRELNSAELLAKFSRSSLDCVIHVSILLLMIKISQSAHDNSLSYCKKYYFVYNTVRNKHAAGVTHEVEVRHDFGAQKN